MNISIPGRGGEGDGGPEGDQGGEEKPPEPPEDAAPDHVKSSLENGSPGRVNEMIENEGEEVAKALKVEIYKLGE